MQQYLTGRVLDRDTNAPIAGARVCLKFKGLRPRRAAQALVRQWFCPSHRQYKYEQVLP